jgi:hypothetical protein
MSVASGMPMPAPAAALESPWRANAQTKTFSVLRNLGFREGDVRAVLRRLSGEGQLAAPTTEQWLRTTLGRLKPRRTRW